MQSSPPSLNHSTQASTAPTHPEEAKAHTKHILDSNRTYKPNYIYV